MFIKYRNKTYSVIIDKRYECNEIIDSEIKFKSEVSKQNFLNLYFNRIDFVHGDKAEIGNIVYNKCYFYNKDDSLNTIKCHIDKREGWHEREGRNCFSNH